MRVKDATILGFFGDLFLGGVLGAYVNFIILCVGVCGIIKVFTKDQVLTVPLGGLFAGIAAGYFLRKFLF